ncbi:MAG: hypothetical protein K0U12_03560, partial [Gammaproteobacteria bacterium]|nr:hypothetical protein [Gammaproteobacteria bacterium]
MRKEKEYALSKLRAQLETVLDQEGFFQRKENADRSGTMTNIWTNHAKGQKVLQATERNKQSYALNHMGESVSAQHYGIIATNMLANLLLSKEFKIQLPTEKEPKSQHPVCCAVAIVELANGDSQLLCAMNTKLESDKEEEEYRKVISEHIQTVILQLQEIVKL